MAFKGTCKLGLFRITDIGYRYLAVLVSLVYLCDDTADEPLHVVRVVDEVWRAVESDGVGHLGQVQFSIILAFLIVCIVVLNDVVVDSGVVLLEFLNLQFTSFTASSRTTTLLRICTRHPLRMSGSPPT